MQLKKQLTLFTFAGSPTHPTLSPTMMKLTPRQANRPLGQKRIYQIFVFKQTQKSLKTARYNQSKVFIASPAGLGGAGGREWARIRTRVSVPVSSVARRIHPPLSRPPGTRRRWVSLSCPPSPPAARAWPTCRWRKGLRPSVCFPASHTSDSSQNLRPHLLATCYRVSRIRALSSYSQKWGVSKSERETGRFLPKGRSRKKSLTPTGLLCPVSDGEGARQGWRGDWRGGQ